MKFIISIIAIAAVICSTPHKRKIHGEIRENYDKGGTSGSRSRRRNSNYDDRDRHSDNYLNRSRYSSSTRTPRDKPPQVIQFIIESTAKPEMYKVKYNEKGTVECEISESQRPGTPFVATFYGVRIKTRGTTTITKRTKCTRPDGLRKKLSSLSLGTAKDRCQDEFANKWASFYCDGVLTWCGDKDRHYIQNQSSNYPGWHVQIGSLKYKNPELTCDDPYVKVA